MNFGLSVKYSEIDFEEVSLSDLMLIGGGCGESGGGSVTVAQVQQAQQTAAAQPGANVSATVSVTSPSVSGDMGVTWSWNSSSGLNLSGHGNIQGNTGHVEATGSVNAGPGFWASVGNFFSWLFGSH
jgi:hypothetical protein